jgi:predicted signal transduction protein with EAL and GGDEF domain
MRGDRQANDNTDEALAVAGQDAGAGAQRGRMSGSPGLETARDRIAEWMAVERIEEGSGQLHAMLLGLRRFDAVNLAYGEAAGDDALDEVTARMSNFAAHELDGRWLVCRAGGGSFLLLATEPCSRERWQLVAGELSEAVARPITVPSGVLRLSPRIALVRMLAGETIDLMLDRLGQALSEATLSQGARLVWANGEASPAGRSSAQLEADLLEAIERDEIEIMFQPQFRLPDDRLVGAEALARWNHPELGRIGASALFAIAERTDHVAPLSRLRLAGGPATFAQRHSGGSCVRELCARAAR